MNPHERRRQRWCNPSCGDRARRARKAQSSIQTCPVCESTFSVGGRGRRPKWCSARCRYWARNKPGEVRPRERRCATCETDISDQHLSRLFCSRNCRNTSLRREPLPARVCALPECDQAFTPLLERQRCCTERHGDLLNKREASKRNALERARCHRCKGSRPAYLWYCTPCGSDLKRENKRAARHRRRAIKRGTQAERIVPAEIFDRDGWRCGLCRKRVNPKLRYPHRMSASLDHVTPLAAGGTHTRGNVQCSHLACNVQKNYRGASQLLLFAE